MQIKGYEQSAEYFKCKICGKMRLKTEKRKRGVCRHCNGG